MATQPHPTASVTPPGATAAPRANWWFQRRWQTAFWKVATLFSLTVNAVLLVVLLSVGRLLFDIKKSIASPLLDTLHGSFAQMDQSHIVTTITVEDEIPIAFDLPVQTDTVVRLTEPTPIEDVPISIQQGGISINAPADIVLPEGTPLSIRLDITVPVEQTIPVKLLVPVDIALQDTGLHAPFTALKNLIGPYKVALDGTPSDWGEVLCGFEPLCRFAK